MATPSLLIIRHDGSGPFFGECVYIVKIAFSA